MTALLRSTANGSLPAALAAGQVRGRADLFTFTLLNGTVLYWTSWDQPVTTGGHTYLPQSPWLERTNWNVVNTMEVPSLTVFLRALNTGFNGGANIKTQVHNGLFDGAGFLLTRAFMTTPPAVLDTVGLFGGVVAGIDLTATTATITIKGKTNLLDQYAPRNLYQIGCNHGFCDAGCTLSRAAFTANFAAGSSGLTSSFLPWASAPGNATNYQSGQITMTSGAASGQTRTVAQATSAGLWLAYPLYETPSAGDTFSATQGCDKSYNSGSGQSCTDRSNTQHYRGYEFVPPPNMAY